MYVCMYVYVEMGWVCERGVWVLLLLVVVREKRNLQLLGYFQDKAIQYPDNFHHFFVFFGVEMKLVLLLELLFFQIQFLLFFFFFFE